MFEERTDLSGVRDSIQKLKDEIQKIIVGQEEMINLLIASLLARGHVLIEGNPGVAKTLTVKLLSRALSTGFSRIQFTPDLMPSDVSGTSIYNFKSSEFEFKKGPIFSNLVLIDEINRAPAKTQAALFEVMEEKQLTYDGVTYPMDGLFMIAATQNPIEMEGTYRLPEAQMDRFLFKINVDYPSAENEEKLLGNFHKMRNTNDLTVIQKVVGASEMQGHQNLIGDVVVEDKLLKYIVNLVQKTRNNRDITIGASPRASQAILAGAKAIAVINGRDFVVPDDIVYIAPPALRHRIQLSPEKEMEGATPDDVIQNLIKSIEVPR